MPRIETWADAHQGRNEGSFRPGSKDEGWLERLRSRRGGCREAIDTLKPIDIVIIREAMTTREEVEVVSADGGATASKFDEELGDLGFVEICPIEAELVEV